MPSPFFRNILRAAGLITSAPTLGSLAGFITGSVANGLDYLALHNNQYAGQLSIKHLGQSEIHDPVSYKDNLDTNTSLGFGYPSDQDLFPLLLTEHS
ncbi:hypothetical protein Cyrtocomes_01221 [Candidatus Cyrtobacter comes]|uniref:Uncharacterized protein n=1 Tax=Candidatus Cyrtobacter comes TaxID=675776 RepID=A0ABU5L9M9_9RICK|nr:hypothetical protein [Candidatus Cyrtobacter comes]MDZ5762825.1 hypothetical protein [Candidatus Cyrtobacter comes]